MARPEGRVIADLLSIRASLLFFTPASPEGRSEAQDAVAGPPDLRSHAFIPVLSAAHVGAIHESGPSKLGFRPRWPAHNGRVRPTTDDEQRRTALSARLYEECRYRARRSPAPPA